MNKLLARLNLVALSLIFIWFTWRGMLWFYSGDDMMNMYFAWSLNPWRILRAQVMIWLPVYRPFGAAVYRVFYSLFGFHPLPLYILMWLVLALNALLSVKLFRVLRLSAAAVTIAVAFALVHGTFQDLYLSAGTMYDRFWYLFTALGLIVYARSDPKRPPPFFSTAFLCIFCMNSKESGVALPALLACYEVCFNIDSDWKRRLKQIAPLFGALAFISLQFVFGRVKHTPELMQTAAYTPHADPVIWFTRVAEYFSILAYRHVPFTATSAAVLLFVMLGLALLARNRSMIFGWLFFVITITPMALIASRPGYVLYVPELGLALYIGALAQLAFERRAEGLAPQLVATAFIAAMLLFHLKNWPPPDTPHNPEYQLTTQMREKFPTMPGGAKILFVNDNFPSASYDAMFCLRLLYRDRNIFTNRLVGPPDQQPDPKHPIKYDHVLSFESGAYLELDNRDYQESIRLHLTRDYAPGRELDFARCDHAAYIVSGVKDNAASEPTRWTDPRAVLKYDIFPAPALFTAKIWVPDFVAKTGQRTMTVAVNGHEVGNFPLSKDGMNEIAMPVEASMITPNGFTIVEMNVANPYKDTNSISYGVVLLRAGFEYRANGSGK